MSDKVIMFHCPTCEAGIPAKSNIKQRTLEGKLTHVNQVYIQCPKCETVHHQFYTTKKLIRLRQRADKMATILQYLEQNNPSIEPEIARISSDLKLSREEARTRMIEEVKKKFHKAKKRFAAANKHLQTVISIKAKKQGLTNE